MNNIIDDQRVVSEMVIGQNISIFNLQGYKNTKDNT